MQSIPFTDVRAQLAKTLRELESDPKPRLISRRGQAAGVLMSWPQYQAMSASGSGFGQRLAQWRSQCSPDLAMPDDLGEAFADLRSSEAGRTVDWPA